MCPFLRTREIIHIKSTSTESRVHAEYFWRKLRDQFGLIVKASEDKATDGIENWSLSTTPCTIN